MKRILTFVVLVFAGSFCSNAMRQAGSVLRGTVVDKMSGAPAGWATVALMGVDSTVVAGTTCGEDGAFELKAAPGGYILSASLIGYKEHASEFTLEPGDNDAGVIAIEEDAVLLDGARLTGSVNLIDVKVDKVVMNVSQSAFAHGSNALELIRKAPGVTVDKDGNIKLNGKAVSVWIDGRPSQMDGKALEALLTSTGGDSIDKFELMEHPSAKYDAEGQGGIINIKTKRNMLSGFNGSIGVSGGAMHFGDIDETPWDGGVRTDLSYRTARTNTFLNVSKNVCNSPVKLTNDLDMARNGFHQSSFGVLLSRYDTYNVKIGNDWFIDDRNTLGAIVYVPGYEFSLDSQCSSAVQTVNGAMTQSSSTKIENGPGTMIQHSLNLNYTHVFDEARGAELTANADYFNTSSVDSNSQVDTVSTYPASGAPLVSGKSMRSDNIYDVYSAKVDYQSVVHGRYMLESGAKWALSCTDNTSLETQTGLPDNPSDFVYRENIAAAYASLAGQLSEKVSFKVGLRGEYTDSFGDWKSSGTQTHRSYFDFFPTVFAGYAVSDKSQLNLSYSRRISRPSYGHLNPVKSYVDSKTYTVGNPDILPQYNDNLSLGAMVGRHFNFALVYSHAGNIVNQTPSYDMDGNQYLTWGNTGKMDMGVLSANITALPIGKHLEWTLNATPLCMSSTIEGTDIRRFCWAFQGYTDLTVLLPGGWKADIDANYSAPMAYGYYDIHASWVANLAAKKSFLDDRLTLTMKLDDIFRSTRGDIDIIDVAGTGVTTSFRQTFYEQKFIMDFVWKFGKAQGPVKHRKVGDLEEFSRAGGKGGSGLGK